MNGPSTSKVPAVYQNTKIYGTLHVTGPGETFPGETLDINDYQKNKEQEIRPL